MDISKFDKADVLRLLYNNAQVLGMGILQARDGDMTHEEASELLRTETYFDYVHGRVMKVDLSGDNLDTGLYNRDNGQGAAERALAPLSRKEK